jgi:hypothetical protein
MPRRDPEAFGDLELLLAFVAGRVGEAERAEEALTSAGIDYCLEAVEFSQGLLAWSRTGLGFYVLPAQAAAARRELARADLQTGVDRHRRLRPGAGPLASGRGRRPAVG